MSNPDGSLGSWTERPAHCEECATGNSEEPGCRNSNCQCHVGQPWPPTDVIRRLADFADYQLTQRDYDGHGHEELRVCVNRARELLAQRQTVRQAFWGMDPRDFAGLIVQDVCELPDRTSPEEWPEAMIVTSEELTRIILRRVGLNL